MNWNQHWGSVQAVWPIGTRRGWGVSVTPRPLFTPGKDPVPIVQEAKWAPGPAWTSAENLVPIGIRSPDRPAHNQSLYRLSYPAHTLHMAYRKIHTYNYVFTYHIMAYSSVFHPAYWTSHCPHVDQIVTGISDSKVIICIGNSGSNPERAPCR